MVVSDSTETKKEVNYWNTNEWQFSTGQTKGRDMYL